MARAAHPHAMQPATPGKTRTAPPMAPPKFPMKGRYRAYTLFGWTGVLYLLVPLVALRAVWALGTGEAAWNDIMAQFAHPLYVAFHMLSLVAVLFVGARFFRLFPKAQPARIGPAKPPPQPVILGMLYLAWYAVSGLLAVIFAGGLF